MVYNIYEHIWSYGYEICSSEGIILMLDNDHLLTETTSIDPCSDLWGSQPSSNQVTEMCLRREGK